MQKMYIDESDGNRYIMESRVTIAVKACDINTLILSSLKS